MGTIASRWGALAAIVISGVVFLMLPTIGNSQNDGPSIPVSMVAVLQGSILKDGTSISVVGYMEGPFLFLTKEHAHALDYPSALRVVDLAGDGKLYEAGCSKKHVKVVGRLFRRDAINFEIRKVKQILDISARDYCFSPD